MIPDLSFLFTEESAEDLASTAQHQIQEFDVR
jgi:hypothetical protein